MLLMFIQTRPIFFLMFQYVFFHLQSNFIILSSDNTANRINSQCGEQTYCPSTLKSNLSSNMTQLNNIQGMVSDSQFMKNNGRWCDQTPSVFESENHCETFNRRTSSFYSNHQLQNNDVDPNHTKILKQGNPRIDSSPMSFIPKSNDFEVVSQQMPALEEWNTTFHMNNHLYPKMMNELSTEDSTIPSVKHNFDNNNTCIPHFFNHTSRTIELVHGNNEIFILPNESSVNEHDLNHDCNIISNYDYNLNIPSSLADFILDNEDSEKVFEHFSFDAANSSLHPKPPEPGSEDVRDPQIDVFDCYLNLYMDERQKVSSIEPMSISPEHYIGFNQYADTTQLPEPQERGTTIEHLVFQLQDLTTPTQKVIFLEHGHFMPITGLSRYNIPPSENDPIEEPIIRPDTTISRYILQEEFEENDKCLADAENQKLPIGQNILSNHRGKGSCQVEMPTKSCLDSSALSSNGVFYDICGLSAENDISDSLICAFVPSSLSVSRFRKLSVPATIESYFDQSIVIRRVVCLQMIFCSIESDNIQRVKYSIKSYKKMENLKIHLTHLTKQENSLVFIGISNSVHRSHLYGIYVRILVFKWFCGVKQFSFDYDKPPQNITSFGPTFFMLEFETGSASFFSSGHHVKGIPVLIFPYRLELDDKTNNKIVVKHLNQVFHLVYFKSLDGDGRYLISLIPTNDLSCCNIPKHNNEI